MGLRGFCRMQGRRDERFLLALMLGMNAGRGCRRPFAAGIEQRVILAETGLQPVAYLVPGALVLRLLLAPDDLTRFRIAVEDRLVLLGRERIELFDADQRDVRLGIRFAACQQVVINLAAAEYDAPDAG